MVQRRGPIENGQSPNGNIRVLMKFLSASHSANLEFHINFQDAYRVLYFKVRGLHCDVFFVDDPITATAAPRCSGRSQFVIVVNSQTSQMLTS